MNFKYYSIFFEKDGLIGLSLILGDRLTGSFLRYSALSVTISPFTNGEIVTDNAGSTP